MDFIDIYFNNFIKYKGIYLKSKVLLSEFFYLLK